MYLKSIVFIVALVSEIDVYLSRAAPLAAVASMIEWIGACFPKKVKSGCHVREMFPPQWKSEVLLSSLVRFLFLCERVSN